MITNSKIVSLSRMQATEKKTSERIHFEKTIMMIFVTGSLDGVAVSMQMCVELTSNFKYVRVA